MAAVDDESDDDGENEDLNCGDNNLATKKTMATDNDKEPSEPPTKTELLCPNPNCPMGRNQHYNQFQTRRNVKTHTLKGKSDNTKDCRMYVSNLLPSDPIRCDFIRHVYHNDIEMFTADLDKCMANLKMFIN